MLAARTVRPVRCTLALAAALALIVVATPRTAERSPSPDEVVSIREARLRKLHLVRPDLIHFPISFDAVC